MPQDFRYALRRLRRTPALTLATILTLTLGVGLNAAVFSVVRAVLLRPLPFSDPDRVVAVWTTEKHPTPGLDAGRWDLPQGVGRAVDWRASNRTFDDLAFMEMWHGDLSAQIDVIGTDGAERLRGALVTPNFFTTLGVRAALGRTFAQPDGSAALRESAVISDGLWHRLFASDARVIGRTIQVVMGRPRGPRTVTVVGVLPRTFRFTYPDETEIWVPQGWDGVMRAPRGALMFQVIGRLKPGVTPAQAQADLQAIDLAASTRAGEQYRSRTVAHVRPFQQALSASARPLIVTLGAVGAFVLVIACLNVMQLLLAGVSRRARDIATRVALGATSFDIFREAAAEAILLAAAATTTAAMCVAAGLTVLRSLIPGAIPRADETSVDLQVVLVCAAGGALAVVLGSAGPVLLGAVRDPLVRLRSGATVAGLGLSALRWRRTMIALQVTAVFVLLAGGGLLLRSFWQVTHVDLGFDGTRVLTMQMRVLRDRSRDEARDTQRLAQFERGVVERVRDIPGVLDVAMTSAVPLRGTDWLRYFTVGDPGPGGSTTVLAHERQVTAEYFELMRIPLLAGRLFTRADNSLAPRRAIVSQALARSIAPGGTAIGRHLNLDPPAEIIGVVGDVRTKALAAEPPPAVYLSRAQEPSELVCLVIRTADGQTTAVAAAVRAAIRDLDPWQPVEQVTTLDRVVAESVADRRFYAVVTGSFGGIGLVLALCGVAGVVSSSVSERVREIAIRMALGARALAVRRMIVREALAPVLVGLVAGTLVAWWSTRWIESQLFGVAPHDPLTLGGGAVGLVLCAALAAYVPSRAATRVDPMIALRAE